MRSSLTPLQPRCADAAIVGTHARVSIRFVPERLSRYPPTAAKPDPRPFIRSRDPRVPGQNTLYAPLCPDTRIRPWSVPTHDTHPTIYFTFPEHQRLFDCERCLGGVFQIDEFPAYDGGGV